MCVRVDVIRCIHSVVVPPVYSLVIYIFESMEKNDGNGEQTSERPRERERERAGEEIIKHRNETNRPEQKPGLFNFIVKFNVKRRRECCRIASYPSAQQ